MSTSSYDPFLQLTTSKDNFGIVGMQTDVTIILADKKFAALKEEKLAEASFVAKPRKRLTPASPLDFNGCILSQVGKDLLLRQKEQGKKIWLIDPDSQDFRQKYIEQRARGAYIASIFQLEATFALSVAAPHQEPSKEDVNFLNRRLKWQIGNMERGLKYIPLDLPLAKIFVFVDRSFANNNNLSSQIGHEIFIANETAGNEEILIEGNIIYGSSTKSKRVTRSILASEIYGMVGGVDMAIAISTTINMITNRLELPKIPIIVCTDSFFLYECLVKFGTSKEKRLMINITALLESYERRELFEVRWINGQDNPADAMTKSNSNKALKKFIDTNLQRIQVDGWVKC